MVGLLCVLAVIARLLFCFHYADLNSDNYWEYGEIAKNVYYGKGYSLFYYEGDTLQYMFNEDADPHKSAFMPPGYVYYLLSSFAVRNVPVRNFLIILGQIALHVFVVMIAYLFSKRYFSERAAFVSAAFVAFSPDFIYAALSYTPTVFYHLTVIMLLLLLYDEKNATNTKTLTGTALLITATIYFRSEFALFAVLILLSFLFRKNIKGFLSVGSIILLLVLPWQIRNFKIFGPNFVPLTTNFGHNFYRGHNPYFLGKFPDESIHQQAKVFEKNDSFEMNLNMVYLHHALESIKDQPLKELKNIFVKIFHLWIFNPSEPRTRNIFYFVPWIIILLLFVIGAVKTCSWQKHHFAYLFLAHTTVIAILFVAIPRYQTMMKIVIISFAGYGAEIMIRHIGKQLRSPSHA